MKKTVKDEVVAVIATGGKQYRVKVGDTFAVEKLNPKKGEKVLFDDLLAGKKVAAEILETKKDKKLWAVRFMPKTRSKRIFGHRQLKTSLKIISIQ